MGFTVAYVVLLFSFNGDLRFKKLDGGYSTRLKYAYTINLYLFTATVT